MGVRDCRNIKGSWWLNREPNMSKQNISWHIVWWYDPGILTGFPDVQVVVYDKKMSVNLSALQKGMAYNINCSLNKILSHILLGRPKPVWSSSMHPWYDRSDQCWVGPLVSDPGSRPNVHHWRCVPAELHCRRTRWRGAVQSQTWTRRSAMFSKSTGCKRLLALFI